MGEWIPAWPVQVSRAPAVETTDHGKFQHGWKNSDIYLKSIHFGAGGGGGLIAKSCLNPVTPQTVAHHALLSMEFSRQEY